MSQLINAILTLFSMITLGIILAKYGLITGPFNQLLSKVLIRAIFPISLFRSAYTQFQDRSLFSEFKYIFLSFSLIVFAYTVIFVFAKLCHVEPTRLGVTRAGAVFSNTIFMGLPLATAFLGEVSSLYVILYFASNTTLFWVLGAYFYDQSDTSSFSLSKLIGFPLRGFLLGLSLVFLGIHLPDFLLSSVNNVANTATPLAMLYIGAMFYLTDYKSLRLNRDLGLVIGFKLIVYPLLTLLILSLPIFDGIPLLLRQTFCLISAMPTQNQVALVAGEKNIHKEYANLLVLSTTLISCITIPVMSTIIMYFLK